MVIVQQGPLLAMFPSVTHVVLRERGIKTRRRGIERQGGVQREREREKGGSENRENNNRLWKGDKLRNKECIHERRGG